MGVAGLVFSVYLSNASDSGRLEQNGLGFIAGSDYLIPFLRDSTNDGVEERKKKMEHHEIIILRHQTARTMYECCCSAA